LPDVRFLDVRFLFLSFLLCLRQNANTTLSLQLMLKFGNIVRVETSRYLTKVTTLQRKADREQLKFLQPSIRLCYNYYVQLVATKRDWMRVPNLKFWSPRQRGGWKLVVHNPVCLRCCRQNANIALSLQLPTKFGNIVWVETSRYLTKITTLRRKADREVCQK